MEVDTGTLDGDLKRTGGLPLPRFIQGVYSKIPLVQNGNSSKEVT